MAYPCRYGRRITDGVPGEQRSRDKVLCLRRQFQYPHAKPERGKEALHPLPILALHRVIRARDGEGDAICECLSRREQPASHTGGREMPVLSMNSQTVRVTPRLHGRISEEEAADRDGYQIRTYQADQRDNRLQLDG